MSEAVIVALVAAIASVAVSYFTAKNETTRQLAQIQVKIDLLWEVYIEDAVREARAAQLAKKNSPVSLSPKWMETMSARLQRELETDLGYYLEKLGSPYDATIETYQKHREELTALAKEKDLRNQAIIGGLFVMARNILEQKK